MKYYDLKNKKYTFEENNKGLSFLYNNFIGRFLLKIVISKPIRNIYRNYMDSKLSIPKIKKFIKKNNINMEDYEEKKYISFNDFFIRKIKSNKRKIEDGLISIADSKLSVYEINDNSIFYIKNSIYTLNELLGEDGSNFKGGYALIFRLGVSDYHHYVFFDNGRVLSKKQINGKFHTVQPIAFKKYKVFNENTRVITYLDTEHYGKVAYIEVGAMMIGKIVNEDVIEFKKGMEKGHFEFGGSTIILLFQKNKIKINQVILENTKNNIETIVKLGNSLE